MKRVVPLFRRSLADTWRGLAGWTVGILAALFLYLPLYPSLAGNGQLQDIVNTLPPELVLVPTPAIGPSTSNAIAPHRQLPARRISDPSAAEFESLMTPILVVCCNGGSAHAGQARSNSRFRFSTVK